MTTTERRLRALEMTTRQHSLVSMKRWLDGLADIELALTLGEASETDREIWCLMMAVNEAELASVVADMGHLGNEK